jgi:hypothetical protein
MTLGSRFAGLYACAVAALLVGCSDGASAPPPLPRAGAAGALGHAVSGPLARRGVGLGAVLTSKHGQIFGFDVNRNGDDGLLATAFDVETFDQDSGQILKTYPAKTPRRTSYAADGILDGDIGLITRYVEPKGSLYAKRRFNVMKPVTKGKFTGKWKPPIKNIEVETAGPNQVTDTTAFFAIELKNQDVPDLFTSNVAKNTFGKVFHLDPNTFGLGNVPQFAQDTSTNQEVVALSPDGGRVGGAAPINVVVDLKTGKQTQWSGFNNGYFGAGYVNGIAIDSTTGTFATTTELNAQVEFYNVATQTGTFAQFPCTGSTSQGNSGAGIANDPVNGLFLVTDPFYCSGSQGSALLVYDEEGNLVETITGFKFAIGEPAPVINPSKRMGWAFGPQFSQLQQFFY